MTVSSASGKTFTVQLLPAKAALIFISANSVNILNIVSAETVLYSSYRVPNVVVEIGTEAGPQ